MKGLRIALTGGSGLVGSRLAELLAPKHDIRLLPRSSELDLRTVSPDLLAKTLAGSDLLIHAAALTDVERCEAERALGPRSPSWMVNVEGTRRAAQAAKSAKCHLVVLSTDFVFPAEGKGPFSESDAPAADAAETNWYGWTKRQGELAAEATTGSLSVLRICYPYRSRFERKTDFARRIIQACDEGRRFPLFDDQWLSPTFIDDVAVAVERLASRGDGGVFHAGSRDLCTPFSFGERLLRASGRDVGWLVRGSFVDFQWTNKTPRPRRGGLVSRRTDALPSHTTDDGIERFARQLRSGT